MDDREESVSNLYLINRNPLIGRALGGGKAAMAPSSNAVFSKSYVVPDVFRDGLWQPVGEIAAA
jgi:hypothetical protein